MKKIDDAEIWSQADYTKKEFTLFGIGWKDATLTFFCGLAVGIFIGILSR